MSRSIYIRILPFLFWAFVWLFQQHPASGQLCTGSLGDPVVHIDFGSPSNPSTGFSAPGYTYSNSSCPNDGFYTITGFSTGCFAVPGIQWLLITQVEEIICWSMLLFNQAIFL